MGAETAIDILAALLSGGSLVALINFIRWYVKRRDVQKRERIPNVLKRVHEVYHILNVLLQETRAARVIILRAENGGSVPALGKALYSTIVYEVFDQPLGSIKRMWDRQELDEPYVRMLCDVATQGHYTIKTDKIAGMLHNLYVTGGVDHSEVFALQAEEGAFFYLSMNFAEEAELTPAEQDVIRFSRNRLKELFTIDRAE